MKTSKITFGLSWNAWRVTVARGALAGAAALALIGQTGCSPESQPASGAGVAVSAPAPKPAASAPAAAVAAADAGDAAWAAAARANGFTVGPLMAAHTAYVFFDTTCPHCAHLWQAAQPLLGKLRMVWIPVGFLGGGARSTAEGAAILSAADPAAAMSQHAREILGQAAGGPAPAEPSAAAIDKINANTALFRALNSDSVPLIVFKNAQTGAVGRHNGAADTPALAAMVGL